MDNRQIEKVISNKHDQKRLIKKLMNHQDVKQRHLDDYKKIYGDLNQEIKSLEKYAAQSDLKLY